MAGMLPGVECARRRRFHQSGSSDYTPAGTRRSSFCLYATGHEKNLISSTSMIRNILSKEIHEETLGDVAREAKERLDAKLKTIRRHNKEEQQLIHLQGSYVRQQKDALSCNYYKGVKKFSWNGSRKAKKGWLKVSSEQAECAVCLEDFKAGDVLVQLPCSHSFHSDCVVPWLESSSHCPCCRMTIFSK